MNQSNLAVNQVISFDTLKTSAYASAKIIRALIIDKDNSPQWAFTLSELNEQKVQSLFPLLSKY
jgi:hypothetical protein